MMISVLVPVYGVERYIERCAISLFEQTYQDLEFLFVDDCSPDQSINVLRSVMERYPQRQAQVRILKNDRNRGVGYVRARAVNEAHGECIMFVDSDDFIPPHAAELLARRMKETGADIVDGAYQESTTNGLSRPIKAPHVSNHTRLIKLMLCQDFVPAHLWARLIRRSLFIENGINTVEGVDFSEDFSVMPCLMSLAKREVINDVVYFYNMENQASYTHSTTTKHIISMIRSNAIVYDFFTNRRHDSHYLTAAQVGLLNMIRNVRRNNGDPILIEQYCPWHTQDAFFHFLERGLRGSMPFWLANTLFLATRRLVALL